MNKQVLDIKQMKHLIKLGVDDSKASLCWIVDENMIYKPFISLSSDAIDHVDSTTSAIPAFTLQDILDLLPESIKTTNYTFHLHINYEHNHIAYAYTNGNGCTWLNQSFRINNNLLEAAYKMLCWCAENGYLKQNEP